MACDVCGLPDPYNGTGDGINSCDCPRCDCGCAAGSDFCTCPDSIAEIVGWPDDDEYDVVELDVTTGEISRLRPGEPPRKITTVHLPGDHDAERR